MECLFKSEHFVILRQSGLSLSGLSGWPELECCDSRGDLIKCFGPNHFCGERVDQPKVPAVSGIGTFVAVFFLAWWVAVMRYPLPSMESDRDGFYARTGLPKPSVPFVFNRHIAII
jgi:hypothetical protein